MSLSRIVMLSLKWIACGAPSSAPGAALLFPLQDLLYLGVPSDSPHLSQTQPHAFHVAPLPVMHLPFHSSSWNLVRSF